MSDKWLRAATIGSIWASIEIIIGSFLHNLRLPLAGTILSFFAVVLMVSFLRLWPRQGIIWRAGLICALMKSISPSAVILGPMTGIMLEAFLMEMGILLLGVNLAGMIVGGMLAVLSALFHKALNLLILYGSDLATLLDRLVLYAAKQLHAGAVSGLDVLIFLAALYLTAGALAAFTGWRLSSGLPDHPDSRPSWEQSPARTNRLFELSERQSFSIILLAAHVAILTLLLLGINRFKLIFWLLPVALYLFFCLFRYKRALRQLLRPRFWVQMVLITLLSAVLLESVASGSWFSRAGFEAGILMNIRAFLVITAFAAISTELKNPLIKALVFRRGVASLYKSVSLAFSVLPGILNLTARNGKGRLAFHAVIKGYLLRANSIFEQFRDLEASLPEITLITGDREQGKTTFVSRLIDQLKSEGKRVCGFLAIGIHDSAGVRTGFAIRNIETGEEAEFCITEGNPEWEKIGRFRINPAGIARGYEWMSPEYIKDADILVIDELGPLEMADRGWSGLIERILHDDPKPMIWTARRTLAPKIAVKWNVGKVTVIDAGKNPAGSPRSGGTPQ